MNDSPVDKFTCPLCGGPNACGMAAGRAECWCFDATIPESVLARVPEAAKNAVCVCAACASGAAPKRELKIAP